MDQSRIRVGLDLLARIAGLSRGDPLLTSQYPHRVCLVLPGPMIGVERLCLMMLQEAEKVPVG